MSGKYSDRDREELIHLLECYTTESEALEFAIENADYLLKDHQSDRAVDADLEYLRRVGVDWSPHPTKDEVRQEYERIGRQLGSRLIEALVDLPPMTDPVCRATLDVLTVVEEPAHFTDENLRCLV